MCAFESHRNFLAFSVERRQRLSFAGPTLVLHHCLRSAAASSFRFSVTPV